MDMTGKTVMITGASRGIGAEAARVFANAGANVVCFIAGRNDNRKLGLRCFALSHKCAQVPVPPCIQGH